MKTILFDIPGLADNKIFNPEARDGVTEPFIYLRDQLRQRGYDLTTADNIPLDNCEMIWFWEVPHHFNKNASLSRQLKNFIKKLIAIQYKRNDVDLAYSTFRVIGSSITINLPYIRQNLRVEIF